MLSCGAELANDAIVPEQLATLMRHVARNLDAHAHWVGQATPEAQSEQTALTQLAHDYRAIAAAAERAATTMRGMEHLQPAPHDPARWDRQAFIQWMREKIHLQRAFAALLLDHAHSSERILSEAGGALAASAEP